MPKTALFALPYKPIFLISSNARDFEYVPLGIWKGIWPGLKAEYAFCTGSLSNRVIDNTPLDLQIIPRSSLSTIRREANNALFLDEESKGIDRRLGDVREMAKIQECLQKT